MKKIGKKLLSVLLVSLLLFSVASPASAAWGLTVNKYPVIHIFGDGNALYDKDGNKLLEYRDLLNGINNDGEETEEDEERRKEIYKSVANVVLPFLIEGLGTGNYDNYYKALQKEIGELFEGILLDKNGENHNGSSISKEELRQMDYKADHDQKDSNGNYRLYNYIYGYDWRLDPLVIADELHEYIERVKKSTNSSKVALSGRCLGSSVVTAYVAKYGMDSIHAVCFDGGVVNGAEVLSETISGKFRLNGDAINRFLIDCDALGMFKVDEFINEIIDMLSKAGVFKTIAGVTKETIYYKVVEGVTSALALSTFFTFPSYWAAVKSEDYEDAKNYVFGPEGSEKRKEYAGLIAKLDNYDRTVRQKIPEIMNTINEGGNLAIIAKYGVQIVPFIESNNAIADEFASVECASYGATTSDIYSTLPEDYISMRISEGKGKYISPDKQIDASTCQFPDQTWFIKGCKHSKWSAPEDEVIYNVIASDTQLTVEDSRLSQFMAYDVATDTAEAMNGENCDTYYWKANKKADYPESDAARLFFFITSLLKVLMSLVSRLLKK